MEGGSRGETAVGVGRFNIENLTARQALLEAQDKHTRRWQTKEGTYRLKEKLLPDVRDTDRLVTVAWGIQRYRCDMGHTEWAGTVYGQLELCGFFREFNY